MSDVDDEMAAMLSEMPTSPESHGTDIEPAAPALPPCTEAEAKALVNKARKHITSTHDLMVEIIRRRAWEPLGYNTPAEFWAKEFSDTEGGFSRQHGARLGRVLALIYGLYERFGDDALALNVAERSLRAIPESQQDALQDKIKERITDLPSGWTAEDVQRITDEEVQAARAAAENPDAAASVDGDLQQRLAALGFNLDPDMLRPDAVGRSTGGSGGAGNNSSSADASGRWDNPETATLDGEDDDELPDDRKGFSASSTNSAEPAPESSGVELSQSTTAAASKGLSAQQMVLAAERGNLIRGLGILAGITSPEDVVARLTPAEKDSITGQLDALDALISRLRTCLANDDALDLDI